MLQILLVFRRYGVDEMLQTHSRRIWTQKLLALLPGPAPEVADMEHGERLRMSLQELGPIFVKFGQLLSMRADFLPNEVIDELKTLQNQVAPFPSDEAMAIIEKEQNASLDQLFAHFDRHPIAAASVAQVHAAELITGESVVVKILRPGVDEDIRRDIDLLYTLARVITWIWPDLSHYRAAEVVASGEQALRDSVDLVVEGANASRFRANFIDDDNVVVPKVYWDYTTSKIMVMERIDGIALSDIDGLRNVGVNLPQLATNVVDFFCKQVFRDGYFHGDFHPGNVFIGENGECKVVDFGIMGTVTDVDSALIADIIKGLTGRDYRAVAEAAINSGWAPNAVSVDALEIKIRAVTEPIFDKSIDEIPVAWVLGRLFRILNEFEIRIQPQLLVLQHTMASIEGEVRTIHPHLKLSQTLRPHVQRWAKERYSVAALVRRLQDDLPFLVTSVPGLPRLVLEALERIRDMPAKQQGAASGSAGAEQVDVIARRVLFYALGFTAAVAGIIKLVISGFGFTVILCAIVAGACLSQVLSRQRRPPFHH